MSGERAGEGEGGNEGKGLGEDGRRESGEGKEVGLRGGARHRIWFAVSIYYKDYNLLEVVSHMYHM